MTFFDRRQFCRLLGAASGGAVLAAQPDRIEPQIRDGFPSARYTPFGYLDNPWHTWDLTPSGVLRSLPGIGFGWYFPAGPGGYFDYKRNNIYALEFSLAFAIGSRRFRSLESFDPGQLDSPHHSKNVLAYAFSHDDVQITSYFALQNQNALGVVVKLLNGSGQRQAIRVLAIETYRLGGSEWWGRDGLAGAVDASARSVSIRPFAAGIVSTIAGSQIPAAHFLTAKAQDIDSWFEASSTPQAVSYYPEPLHSGLRYQLVLEPHVPVELTLVLARGVNAGAAAQNAATSITKAPGLLTQKRAEDDAFWNHAPQLEGDWPAHWKNGWVYDFETLRMMVRQPVGIYKHRWDAMQVQAPRNVLAETSIDMWALSYAAPAIAKEVFLGQFQDSRHDNIPCMREDGVMNMVAADGSACGTSISWCYPFFCASSIFARTQDLAWLRLLYPGLARLLRWTLKNRRDADGFLVGKCSWETVMDASKRFLIEQPTGGELTEFLRLPELQAAAAQAGRILALFAQRVNDPAGAEEWKRVEADFSTRTQQFWKDGWFRDFDARRGNLVLSTAPDPAQAGPIFCGLASDHQKREALRTLHELFERSREQRTGWDDGLAWSSLVLPYLEAIWITGERALAGEVVAQIAGRIYESMDRRQLASDHESRLGWPGVSCEIWGAHGAFGGEGYGWGAVMPAHVIRNILGLRETDDPKRLMLCPNLPKALVVPGKRYALRGFQFGARRLRVELLVLDSVEIRVTAQWSNGSPPISVVDENGSAVAMQLSGAEWRFTAPNHSAYVVNLHSS